MCFVHKKVSKRVTLAPRRNEKLEKVKTRVSLTNFEFAELRDTVFRMFHESGSIQNTN